MLKIFRFVIFSSLAGCLALLVPAVASAGPIGVPGAILSAGRIALSAEYDNASRDAEVSIAGIGVATPSFGADRLMGRLSFALTNDLELFGRAGGARAVNRDALFEGDFGTAYGVGIRWTILGLPGIRLGTVLQGTKFTTEDKHGWAEVIWREYEAAVGLSGSLAGIHPYAAISYSRVDAEASKVAGVSLASLGVSSSIREKDPIVYVVGIEGFLTPGFALGAEARTGGESAIGVRMTFAW